MPHSPEDKKRALARVRRIRGQVEALERALESGADCAPVIQQIAAIRGAMHGLLTLVIESYVRETFTEAAATQAERDDRVRALNDLVRTYLK